MATNLVGQFHIDKSNLLKPNLHLVIGSRKKQSANKPKHFLLEKTGSSFKYLSSLYEFDQDMPDRSQEAQIFSFDWQGKDYLLTLKTAAKQAEISIMETGSFAAKPLKGGGGGSTCP